uniref:Uncharacterized protein n=1 Tax=Oryza brachyantha TaxID=4533 RepID=J3MJG6_ORYBR
VILNDPFLGKRIEEGNFITVPLRDEFLENARMVIFKKIYSSPTKSILRYQIISYHWI